MNPTYAPRWARSRGWPDGDNYAPRGKIMLKIRAGEISAKTLEGKPFKWHRLLKRRQKLDPDDPDSRGIIASRGIGRQTRLDVFRQERRQDLRKRCPERVIIDKNGKQL